jgi:formylmethanofuran dehydrogenase subunit E
VNPDSVVCEKCGDPTKPGVIFSEGRYHCVDCYQDKSKSKGNEKQSKN